MKIPKFKFPTALAPLALALFAFAAPAGAQEDTPLTIDQFKEQFVEVDATVLKVEGERLMTEVEASETAIDTLEAAIALLTDEEETAAKQQELADAVAAKDVLVEKHTAILGLVKDLDSAAVEQAGIDVTAWELFSMENTGALTADNISVGAVAGLVETWIQRGKDWAVDNGPGLLFQAIWVLVILFIFRILAKIAGKVVRRAVSSSKLNVSSLLKDFAVNTTVRVVFLLGVLIALSQLGFPIGPILAGLGVVGFVVGFALQDTLSNFAAGLMLLLYRPYDIGDFVNAGGVMGSVNSMNLVSTTILTPDNQKLIVPNSAIWGGVITNVTANETRRVDMVIGVGYGDDLDRTGEVLMEELKSHELVLEDPAPVVRVHNLGESSVDFIVRPWVKTSDYWAVHWDLTKSIKQRLDNEGISIPFPQRDLHLIPEGEVLTPQEGAAEGKAMQASQQAVAAAGVRNAPADDDKDD